ncbi:hypothetical protein BJV78DRAFT_94907 [Lactifluus subvellereus]|nr:hypothetical protein BJV78DRAFT_94907 [Lactifluus subvellereus]
MSLPDIDFPHTGAYIYLNSIFDLSAAVILYYDYALTLPREIQLLWPPHNKLGWFTLTCLLNRYLPIFGHIPFVISYFVPGSFPVCHRLHEYRRGLIMVLQTLVGTLCIIRVYALYGRCRRVLGLLLVIYVTAIINASVILTISRRTGNETALVISSTRACNQITTASGGLYTALAWTGVLVFDSVIFFLTLYKAFTIGKGIFLLDVIVRDGAVYFSALFIMNLVNILTLRFAPPELKNSTATLTNVISTTLVARLVLNLREQNTALAGLPIFVDTVEVSDGFAGRWSNDKPLGHHLCPGGQVNVRNSPEQFHLVKFSRKSGQVRDEQTALV